MKENFNKHEEWKDELEQRASQIEEGKKTYPEFAEKESEEQIPEKHTLEWADYVERKHKTILAEKFKGNETINGVEIQVTWVPDGLMSKIGEYEIYFPQINSSMNFWPIGNDVDVVKNFLNMPVILLARNPTR